MSAKNARNERAAQRSREERKLKKQAWEAQLGLSKDLQESEGQVTVLRKTLRRKENDLKLAEKVCEQAVTAWDNHECPYSRLYYQEKKEMEALKAELAEEDLRHDAYLRKDSGRYRGSQEYKIRSST